MNAAVARAATTAAAVLAAALAAVAGVALTGAAAPSLLVDPGPLVRWGLPVVAALADVAAAVTIGTLVLLCVALPATRPATRPVRTAVRVGAGAGPGTDGEGPGPSGTRDRHARDAFAPGLSLVVAASAAWAVLTVVRAVLLYADVSGRPLSDPGFGSELTYFLRTLDLGRGLAFTALVAAVVATLAAGVTRLGAVGLLTVLSFVGLVPSALAGHSASSTSHETAVTSLGLHLLGVTVWVGGLAGLVLLRGRLTGPDLATAAARFSPLALWAVVLVGGSGAVNAWLRLGGVDGLTTSSGALVVAKTALLAVLVAAGWLHRRGTVTALAAGRPGAFTRLAVGEVVVMAATLGVGAALARTAPPVPDEPAGTPTLAESVTGYALPPEPTPGRWLTTWQPDLLWIVLVGLMVGLYLAGVVRLRRRGDAWPVLRVVCWLAGALVLTWTTSGAPIAYGRVLFSAHMVGHMTTSMVVPLLLVLGAPATLALRALTPRGDGTRGPREWLVAVLESRYLAVLSHPVVAATLFAGSLVVFYYTDLFRLALTTHVGHELMHLHFLLAGYLFAWVIVGVDPGPHRPTYPLRLVLLFATMAFHAFFGISLISTTTVIQPDYFGGLGRTWGRSLLEDQNFGGGLTWGIGEVPTLLLAIVLAVQWARDDARTAAREDRRADRDGDSDLTAYNEMLAGLAARDGVRDSKDA